MTGEDLKKAVLQAAVLGKITIQDFSAQSGTELLQSIGRNPVCAEDLPFELPENWAWAALGDLGDDCDHPFADGPFGSNLKREHYTTNREVRIVQLSNIGESGWRDDNVKYTSYEHLETIERSEVSAGDIVIAKMMPAGRAIVVPSGIAERFVLSSDAVKVVPHKSINKRYLLHAINSTVFKSQVYSEVSGITRVRTSLSKLKRYLVPIPPLEEQERIVAKLDEVMPLIEEYGRLQEQRNKLDAELPEKLRKAIHSASVRGDITTRHIDDESAVDHLAEYGIEAVSANTDSAEDSLPDTWSQARVKSLATLVNGRAFKPSDWSDSGLPIVRIQNLNNPSSPYNHFDGQAEEKHCLHGGELLFAWSGTPGTSFGAHIWDGGEAILNQHIFKVVFQDGAIDKRYFEIALNEKVEELCGCAVGSAGLRHVRKGVVEAVVIPIPPIEEQERIVAKLDEVMPLIESLGR